MSQIFKHLIFGHKQGTPLLSNMGKFPEKLQIAVVVERTGALKFLPACLSNVHWRADVVRRTIERELHSVHNSQTNQGQYLESGLPGNVHRAQNNE